MGSWLNRFQALAARNGTTSHSLDWSAGFSATSGRLLILIVSGPVTTTTPSGWTLHKSAINNTGTYVFTKTAAGGETSASVTHNSSNFPVQWEVLEYPSGSTMAGTPGGLTNQTLSAWAQVTGLTGTNEVIGVAGQDHSTGVVGTISVSFTAPWIEDTDADAAFSTTDGAYLATCVQTGVTAASATPVGTISQTSGSNGERITFAVAVAGGGTNATATPSTVAPPAVTIGTPTVSTGATATPSTVAGAVSVPTPTVAATGNATATPSRVNAVASIPTPTVVVPTNATATPARVNAVASIPTPLVLAGSQWTLWDGQREVRLILNGMWNGVSIVPLTFDEVIA